MGRTSIPCSEETRELLKRDKEQRNMGWDEYLRTLAGEAPDDLDSRLRELDRRVSDIESKMGRR